MTSVWCVVVFRFAECNLSDDVILKSSESTQFPRGAAFVSLMSKAKLPSSIYSSFSIITLENEPLKIIIKQENSNREQNIMKKI
ncbi:hypothetical protein M0802_016794 [Mischocyttarus mexicanus]|nr:hypothetical protein M0802_016794 [Mischocyttarus mexicanus]